MTEDKHDPNHIESHYQDNLDAVYDMEVRLNDERNYRRRGEIFGNMSALRAELDKMKPPLKEARRQHYSTSPEDKKPKHNIMEDVLSVLEEIKNVLIKISCGEKYEYKTDKTSE